MKMHRTVRSIASLVLFLLCLLVGYGFYRANQRDLINSIFFTIGMMGLGQSLLRQSAEKQENSKRDTSPHESSQNERKRRSV